MRAIIFNILFAITTIFFTLICAVFSFIPSRKPIMWALRRYCTRMVQVMRLIGIKPEVTGHENIPDGPAIIASKHQSYGDGFVLFSQIKDLSVVTGDHITKFPFISRILNKMNAVVVSSCGGAEVQRRFVETSRIIHEQKRKILIFPEGHLSQVGSHHRYKSGVYHLYKDLNCPVVPVAQNLGQRWNQMDWEKHPGPAKIEFLEPIPIGLNRKEFMSLLQDRIETRSLELLDYDNLGALDPELVGREIENNSAKAARKLKEAERAERESTADMETGT